MGESFVSSAWHTVPHPGWQFALFSCLNTNTDCTTVPLPEEEQEEGEEEDRNMRLVVIISDLRNIFIISRFDLTEDCTGLPCVGVSELSWTGDTKGRKLQEYRTVISPAGGVISVNQPEPLARNVLQCPPSLPNLASEDHYWALEVLIAPPLIDSGDCNCNNGPGATTYNCLQYS